MTRADRQNSAPNPTGASVTFAILAGSMLGVFWVLLASGLLTELAAAFVAIFRS